MNLIEQLGGYEKAKLIVNSALDFTHIDIYDGFEYFIYEKQDGNGDINGVLTLNPRLNHTGSAFVQGGLHKYGGWHIGINEIKTALLEYRRQHNIYEESDKIVFIDDFMHGELMTVAWTRKGEAWMDDGAKRCTDLSMIRHATDAEITAGQRL